MSKKTNKKESIDWDLIMGGYIPLIVKSRENPNRVSVIFYSQAVHDGRKFRTDDYIQIRDPDYSGPNDEEPRLKRPATDDDKKRWPLEWANYKRDKGE
jgi:hypothetical protein